MNRPMKSRIQFLLLFVLQSMMTASATEPDYASCFAHPNAQIVINIGTDKSKVIPYKNRFHSAGPHSIISFSGGFGVDEVGKSDESVSWKFVQKTEYGDLYLFSVTNKGKLVKAFPALYDGQSVFTYSLDDIRVKIEPHSDRD